MSAAENTRLPDGCVINVSVGDVQKQARYDPKKLYRFGEAKRVAKVDVYRLVGSCDVKWNLEEAQTLRCKPVGADGDSGIQLTVNVAPVRQNAKAPSSNGKGDAPVKPGKSDTSARARNYLKEQDVEGLLTNAMRALLQAMPQDSTRFLADYITNRGGAGSLPQASPQAVSKLGSGPPRVPLSVAPFGPYYLANVVKAVGPLGWSQIHYKFPNARRLRPTPGSAAFSGPSCALCGLKEEEIHRLKREVSELRAGSGSKVSSAAPANFRNYYQRTLLKILDKGTLDTLYRKFPAVQAKAVVASPARAAVPSRQATLDAPTRSPQLEAVAPKLPRRPFARTASVGTWLAPRPPRPKPGYNKAPSVGTWLMLAPFPCIEEEEAAALRIQAVHRGKQARKDFKDVLPQQTAQALPSAPSWGNSSCRKANPEAFHFRPTKPSVGTWLQPRPFKPMPTFRHKPSVGTWLKPILVEEEESGRRDSPLMLQTMLLRGSTMADFGLPIGIFIL